MTREEVIQTLNNIAWNAGGADREEVIIACGMAIEALSKPSIVRCKDCRYRELDGDDWCRITARPVDDTDYCAWGVESEVEE